MKETIRQVAESYARNHSHFAWGQTLNGRQFADKIRLRFEGDRRFAKLQQVFREHCDFVSVGETGELQMVFDWNKPYCGAVGEKAFEF